MATLRRYCWRSGNAVELDDEDECPECSALGRDHLDLPSQTECGCYAPITARKGGPCILPIGHEGPHVAHPEQIEQFQRQGEKILLFEDE